MYTNFNTIWGISCWSDIYTTMFLFYTSKLDIIKHNVCVSINLFVSPNFFLSHTVHFTAQCIMG